ncbi:MAG: glutamine-hydrolyzing carbamoyl-phosphate synthase small subunit [Clostridia bacterium]|nr:glutamine-hydrolyzing carbamoyl-phosphate synthase small subunit [Clostridia bacterium]
MATLILEDGSRFEGTLFGHKQAATGEVVFTTGMSGYQETITDPSYAGQIVCMTYPLIGNIGINDLDFESAGAHIAGMVVSELCELPSNWQLKKTLDQYLDEQGVTGICGVDTRALTRHIRSHGAMKGRIVAGEATDEDIAIAKAHEIHGRVMNVTCEKPYEIEGEGELTVAVLDLGMKRSFTAWMQKRCKKIMVFPADTAAETILASGCQGAVISAGPGNPKDYPQIVENVRKLMDSCPTMGAGLGHLMMALAAGCETEKMSFGHHGSNQPVKDLARGTCAVTGQSHGYVVSGGQLPEGVSVSHINWNDKSIEGLRYAGRDAFSVQFIPAGLGGPFDTTYIFDEFLDMVRRNQAK